MKPDEVDHVNRSVVAANPLQRALIEKAGHDNGFEHALPSTGDGATLASARHRSQAAVMASTEGFDIRFQPATPALLPELLRSFQPWCRADDVFCVPTLPDLAALLRRAASLSQALPNQAVRDYRAAVAQAVGALSAENRGTEVERLVCHRVGQERYRNALLAYWGGACAVTGVTVTEALRASHPSPGRNVPTMPSGWMPSTAFCWWPISMRCLIAF